MKATDKMTTKKALTAQNMTSVLYALGIIPESVNTEEGYIIVGGGIAVMVHDGECGYIARGMEPGPARETLVELTQDVIEEVARNPEGVTLTGQGMPIAQVLWNEGRKLAKTQRMKAAAHLN